MSFALRSTRTGIFAALKSIQAQRRLVSIARVPRPQMMCTRPSTISLRRYSEATTTGTVIPEDVERLSVDEYHRTAELTLESMLQDLEELLDSREVPGADVEENSGILSLTLPVNGSYVINKQPPNKQLWLSSPISGPKRFDFTGGEWISLRDGLKLVDILEEEISSAIGQDFQFTRIDFS
ncbi:unnamed protein product [Kuraishia capsulata CBS 1993]|uniref:ferroxidase n=1 Tax=Kuraishia capsulata CBS 1993 TaxID=1382522 RepID=W6MF35_9ASCO|nr:uncharacterized protein KUCA_T00000159001 [Kuraishia capsulata CBS 1993]CDK24199.1 unnamed protein product [Kuraishia capsulata CBS 1993]